MILIDATRTAILLVDPLNDVLDPNGKLWSEIRDVASTNEMVPNMRSIVTQARRAALSIFFVAIRRSRPGDLAGWRHANPEQLRMARLEAFAKGSWGGDWHPDFVPGQDDVVVHGRWGQNGFASTDLDLQLRQQGMRRVIVIGPGANTGVEGTGRGAMELGYHVTLVRDATAAASRAHMLAAHEFSGPTFAHAIVTTHELLRAFEPATGSDGRA